MYYGTSADEIVIFEVNTTKLNKNIKFYKDLYAKNGVWTSTHIPKEALKVVYEDDFSTLN